mmetsp:Transcript_86136/g.192639  ORF Transcript_86136/g.192639 Transcript_86136/m.192639 type:complete len:124 (+) Transcript_86136:167-538(+)
MGSPAYSDTETLAERVVAAPDSEHVQAQAVKPGKHVAMSDLECFDSTCAWAPLICVAGKDCLQMVHTWLGCWVLLSFPAPPPPPEDCAAAFFMASSRALFDFSPFPPPMVARCDKAFGARQLP